MPDIRDLLAAAAGPSPGGDLDERAVIAAVRRLRRRRRLGVGGLGVAMVGGIVAIGALTSPPRPLDVVLVPPSAESVTAAASPSPFAPVPAPSRDPATEAPDPSATAVAELISLPGCEGMGEELATWFQPLLEPGSDRASSPLTFQRIALADALPFVVIPPASAEHVGCTMALRNGNAVAVELRDANGAALVRTGSVPWLAGSPPDTSRVTLGSGQPFDARLEGDRVSGSVDLTDPSGGEARRFVWVEAPGSGEGNLQRLAAELYLPGAVPQPARAEYLVPDLLPPGFEQCPWYAPDGGGEDAAACDAAGRLLVVSRRPDGGQRPVGRPVSVGSRAGTVVEVDGARTVSAAIDGYRYTIEAPLDVSEDDVVAALASVLEAPRSAERPPGFRLPDPEVLLSALQGAADGSGVELLSVTITDPDPAAPAGTDVRLVGEFADPAQRTDVAVLRIAPLSEAGRPAPSDGSGPVTLICAEHLFTVSGALEATRAVTVLEALLRQLSC